MLLFALFDGFCLIPPSLAFKKITPDLPQTPVPVVIQVRPVGTFETFLR